MAGISTRNDEKFRGQLTVLRPAKEVFWKIRELSPILKLTFFPFGLANS